MFLGQHIIMISEDHVTLNRSNDAENTAAHHRNKFNTYSHRKQLLYIIIINNITVFTAQSKWWLTII